jgi:hypothetical protein
MMERADTDLLPLTPKPTEWSCTADEETSRQSSGRKVAEQQISRRCRCRTNVKGRSPEQVHGLGTAPTLPLSSWSDGRATKFAEDSSLILAWVSLLFLNGS